MEEQTYVLEYFYRSAFDEYEMTLTVGKGFLPSDRCINILRAIPLSAVDYQAVQMDGTLTNRNNGTAMCASIGSIQSA